MRFLLLVFVTIAAWLGVVWLIGLPWIVALVGAFVLVAGLNQLERRWE